MKKEYRLIKISESEDNIIKKEIVIFELTPIEYSYSGNSSHFNPDSSIENYFFIYEHSQEIIQKFLSNSENIIEMDLSLFELNLILTPEGIRKTFFLKHLAEKRKSKDLWQSEIKELLKNDKQIAFKFSYIQYSSFTYGDNYETDITDLIPKGNSEVELEEKINHVVIGKNKVLFLFETNQGVFTRMEGKIVGGEFHENGQIKSIETLCNWGINNNISVRYEFGKMPISPLNKSSRNIVISIIGKKNEPSIKSQWSLLFGEYVGEVTFGSK